MIIIDGPDGSGKTTLINSLGYERRSFKALYGGTGESERGNWGNSDEAPTAYARQILAAHDKVAFDRFHLSEMIYGGILRGGSGITDGEATLLRRLLRARGVATILCLPSSLERTLANVLQEGRPRPEYQTLDFLATAYNRWVDLWAERAGRDDIIRYDYITDPVPEAPRWRPTCPPSVIGDPHAMFLVVGPRSNHSLDLPYFSMEGASGYFNKSLWDAGFPECELAFANVSDAKGTVLDLQAALAWMPSAGTVITVGEAAQKAALTQGICSTHMLHTMHDPQFWRRMYPSARGNYVSQLRMIHEEERSAL